MLRECSVIPDDADPNPTMTLTVWWSWALELWNAGYRGCSDTSVSLGRDSGSITAKMKDHWHWQGSGE